MGNRCTAQSVSVERSAKPLSRIGSIAFGARVRKRQAPRISYDLWVERIYPGMGDQPLHKQVYAGVTTHPPQAPRRHYPSVGVSKAGWLQNLQTCSAVTASQLRTIVLDRQLLPSHWVLRRVSLRSLTGLSTRVASVTSQVTPLTDSLRRAWSPKTARRLEPTSARNRGPEGARRTHTAAQTRKVGDTWTAQTRTTTSRGQGTG